MRRFNEIPGKKTHTTKNGKISLGEKIGSRVVVAFVNSAAEKGVVYCKAQCKCRGIHYVLPSKLKNRECDSCKKCSLADDKSKKLESLNKKKALVASQNACINFFNNQRVKYADN